MSTFFVDIVFAPSILFGTVNFFPLYAAQCVLYLLVPGVYAGYEFVRLHTVGGLAFDDNRDVRRSSQSESDCGATWFPAHTPLSTCEVPAEGHLYLVIRLPLIDGIWC